MLGPVRMSLRDVAYLMMAVSDNASADLLLGRVGLDAVNRTTARLGLTRTHAVHSFEELFATIREDAGPGGAQALSDPHVITRLRALDPAGTNRSTPREGVSGFGADAPPRAGGYARPSASPATTPHD